MADDPWAQFPTTPPAKPGPDWSGFSSQPPAEDTSIPKAVGFWNNAWAKTQEAAGQGAKDMADLTAPHGPLDLSAVPKALSGAAELAFSPVSGLTEAAGEAVEDYFPKLKEAQRNNPSLPNMASVFNTSLLLSTPAGRGPLVPTKTGELARIVQDEQGRLTTKVIGPPPKDADFQIAAKAIDPTGGLTPPAADVKPSPIKPIEGSPFAGVPRSLIAKTGIPEVDRVVSDLRGILDNPVVDRTRDIPNSWGGSEPITNPTTYLDHRFPKELTVGNVTFDPAEPAVLHENVEEAVIDILKAGGMAQDTALSVAYHGFGNPVEHAWYRAHGMDPAAVEKVLRPILDKIATEKGPNIPADLFRRTYPENNPQLASAGEVPKPTPEEAAKGMQIVRDYQAANPPRTVADKLKDNWQTYGVHPYEAAEVAQRSPAMARDLSSARTPALPLPPRPSKNFIQDTDNNLFRIRQAHVADQSEMLNLIDKLPSSVKNADLQERWYMHGEGDTNHNSQLTPEEGKLYNEVMLPLQKEQRQLWEEAKKTELPVEEYNPYMHRVVRGKTPQIDRLAGEGAGEANPIYNGPGILARSTSSMHERKFFALEDESGNRQLITMKDIQHLSETPDVPLKVGDVINAEQKYTIRQALTREIEENSDVRYYKNALVNTIDNILHLRAVNRAIFEIQKLRDTPEWAKYTTGDLNIAREKGWIQPQMPLFRNDFMDPKLAHVLDDFYGRVPTDGLEATLDKINHYATGSMFWTPVPHAKNAAQMWATERGWDNITPKGMQSLVVDGAAAIRHVVTQSTKYQQILREGGALQYGRVVNQNFYQKLLQRAGMELPKDDKSWGDVAKIVGQSPVDLVKNIYNAASNSLWAVSDMFAVQRVLELEGKGMSTREAIEVSEKIMASYRVPSEILGSRSLQQAYTNPKWFMFSRYHYSVMRGFANMAKDLAVGDAKQKFDTVGRIMAMGVFQLALWPLESQMLTAGYQALTGDQSTKIKAPPAGFGKIITPVVGAAVNADPKDFPKYIQDYYHNDDGLMRQLMNLIPLSPLLKWGVETGMNKYSYSGKPIAEPSDWRQGRYGRVAGQEAEHTAGLIEPYSTVSQAMKQGSSIPQKIIEGAFGLQEHTDKQEEARAKAFHYQDKEAARRKPVGLIEGLTK